MVIVYIIGILIWCFVWGFATDNVAKSKGYDDGFWWGFFLGIIGLLVIGFKPTITANDAKQYESRYLNQQHEVLYKPKSKLWTCQHCGAKNRDELQNCPVCQANKQDFNTNDIKCPSCGTLNNPSREKCYLCDTPLR